MGEALIIGRGISEASKVNYILKTEVITTNTNWTVPAAKDNKFAVRLFGGGAGALNRNAGGGGMMCNNTIVLSQGTVIGITIGKGGIGSSSGTDNQAGGTTAFGTYLSASGGGHAADGGSGGGCYSTGSAGTGYQFGGGGSEAYYSSSHIYGLGGNGGKYGGGGGFILRFGSVEAEIKNTVHGGQFGGNPAYSNGIINKSYYSSNMVNGTNGTNTVGYSNVFDGSNAVDISEDMYAGNLQGYGLTPGNGYSTHTYSSNVGLFVHGAGGYGGNGSNGGGGGGYGGNGGAFAGGGGGYGADGGIGSFNTRTHYVQGAGGGGGYGLYGHGGNAGNDGGIAAGGGVNESNYGNGGNGICIIQYYAVD